MNDIDKIFKNKLNHYSTDVPEGIWDNIESELDHSTRRGVPKWPWVLTSVLTFVTLSVVGFYLFNTQQNSNIQNTMQEPTSIKQEQVANNSLPIAQVLSPESTANQEATTPMVIQSTLDNSSTIVERNHSQNSEVHTSSIAKPTSTSTSIVLRDELIENTQEYQNSYLQLAQNETTLDSGDGLILESHNQEVINALEDNNKYVILKEDLPKVDLPSLSVITEPMKACPFNVNLKDKSLDLYYSADYIDKRMTDRDGGAKLKDMRTATESPMYSFSAGIRLGYNVGYRWNIHTGLNYSQINEKFEYTDLESSKVRIVITKDYIYENGSVVDSIVKQEEVLVPGSTKLTIYNKFRTLDIPVLGRYTIMANRHFSLSAIAGPIVNIASFEKGTIISDETHKPINLSKSDDQGTVIYKNQLGLSLYGSLSLAYHLTSNLDMLVEPYARIQPESITIASYPLYQKFNTYGLKLGLRYKF